MPNLPNLLGSGKTVPRPGSSLDGQWPGGGWSPSIIMGGLANTSTAKATIPPGTITLVPTTHPYNLTPVSNIAGSGGSGSSAPIDFWGGGTAGPATPLGGSPPIGDTMPIEAASSGGGGARAPSKLPWLVAGGAVLALLYLGNQKRRRRR